MIKFYISEGLLIATVIGCLITTRQDKRKISELNNKINDLAGVVKTMKKERIDDWFESASDILTSHQESIEKLEGRFEDEIFTLQLHAKGNYHAIDKLTGEVNEIKEILEKTAGVKFTSEEEE